MNIMATYIPNAIVLHARSQMLELRWTDETKAWLASRTLRAACPCSACEATRIAAKRDTDCMSGSEDEWSPNIDFSAIEPVGHYAIRIVFSDGHDRGIYPWTYLRQLSQLSECAL
jgi:DUF971 family protein